MRSLFLKIFLWFWAAQVVIGLTLYLVGLTTQNRFDERFYRNASATLEARSRAAAVAYEAGGLAALREVWNFSRLDDQRHGTPGFGMGQPGPPRRDDFQTASFYILNGSKGSFTPKFLAGPERESPFAPDVFRKMAVGEISLQEASGARWLARRVDTLRGGHYLAIAKLPPAGGRPGDLLNPWFRPGPDGLFRFLVVVLVMGLGCYALARYLADPAIKLRQATRQFAAGDLSVRVGPQMGKRRDELADLGHDFDLMVERIESLLVSERRLLGDISHELRSPLTRLRLALDLAEQTAENETREYLARIGSEADELNSLIGQLLMLTRLENASLEARSNKNARKPSSDSVIDLQHLVEHVCENADFEAHSHGSHVEVVKRAPCHIIGNGELLHSAVENVVRNAIVHAPQSPRIEVSLEVTAQDAAANTSNAPQKAVIRVRDYGPGVPPEALAELFRPFYRVAEARDRQSGGTGLGLSITERAVHFHGGTIEARNAPGGGLLVEMSLPLHNVQISLPSF